MSFSLIILVVGCCFICSEMTISKASSSEAAEMANLYLNLTQICGFKRCTDTQCCVGNAIIGYCLDSPKEGEPCAVRANAMEEFFCGKCGLKLKCIDGRCRKPPTYQSLKSNLIETIQD
ncbi:unnamed protein product [Larinioides sclopetarius]|uniref:Uncharacterized protein n=1 Tax=Larinioides sclopetarius TaxID=280406 RepID=A0AAV1Z0J2_9ARAC